MEPQFGGRDHGRETAGLATAFRVVWPRGPGDGWALRRRPALMASSGALGALDQAC